MRIGIVCPYSFDVPGGVQSHIIDMATVLTQQGHYVAVLGPAVPETDVPPFVVKGGKSLPIRYNGSVARLAIGPRVLRQTKDFIRAGRFDVLHIHEPNSPSFSMAALYAAHGPIVATYHACASNAWLLQAVKWALLPLLEKIRGGIAVSEMARRWHVEQLGGDPIIIPNGVDTAVYAVARTRALQLQEISADSSSGVADPDSRPEIVFLGRLDEPRKGLEILLQALPLVDRDVRVTVMGSGRARAVPGVDFIGQVSDAQKAEILGRADIYVAPNTGGESFGIVLVEAMAAGCAVVASDLESFRAVCAADSPAPAGLLFANGDAADLARQLRELIDSPTRRTQLAATGMVRAKSYDWDVVAAQVLRVYETVADGTTVQVGK